MKITALALSLTFALSASSFSQILSDDFSTDTLSDYNTPTGGGSRTAFSYTGPGAGSAGRLTGALSNVSSAENKLSIGNFTTNLTLVTQIDFLTTSSAATQNNANVALVGLADSATTFSNNHNGFDVTVRGVQSEAGGVAGDARLRIRLNDSGTGQILSANKFTLANSEWYRLTLTTTMTGTNAFTLSANLALQSSPGVSISSIAPTAVTNAQITALENLFVGFGVGVDAGPQGGLAVDNLIVAVPEPTTVALLLSGLGLVAAARRQRRA